jgi:hypothetical protein
MRGGTFVSLWCVFWCRTVGVCVCEECNVYVCVGWKGERREEKKEERKEREFDMVRVEKCVL